MRGLYGPCGRWEMQLDYELINMEFSPRATYPGYLDLNPLGTVPTFIDGDAFMTESSISANILSITCLLAVKYGSMSLAMAST